tara:strand:+ start:251 stop:523 length:273 start_codon:yes stop_codon:yes gene_type:complete
MSNSTVSSIAIGSSTIGGYQVSTIILGVLFFTSEILPFLRKRDKNNGILDSIVCLLKGSSCVTGKLAETIEKVQKDDIKPEDIKVDLESQ